MTEEKRFRVLVDNYGRIVIPKSVRAKLGLKKESVLQGEIYGENKILLEILAR